MTRVRDCHNSEEPRQVARAGASPSESIYRSNRKKTRTQLIFVGNAWWWEGRQRGQATVSQETERGEHTAQLAFSLFWTLLKLELGWWTAVCSDPLASDPFLLCPYRAVLSLAWLLKGMLEIHIQAFALAQQALSLTAPSPWANTFAHPSPFPCSNYCTLFCSLHSIFFYICYVLFFSVKT